MFWWKIIWWTFALFANALSHSSFVPQIVIYLKMTQKYKINTKFFRNSNFVGISIALSIHQYLCSMEWNVRTQWILLNDVQVCRYW